MFEQAILESTYRSRRAFATGVGFTMQLGLAACLVMAPLIWTQVLPPAQFSMTIGPPPPAPRPPDHTPAIKPRPTRAPPLPFRGELLLPTRIPPHTVLITDTGSAPSPEIGVPGSFGDSAGGNPLLQNLLGGMPAPARPIEKAAEPKLATAEEPKRIRASSLDPGRLLRKVDPLYPPIARSARIEGTVELRAVIGTDGRVRELIVLSGHPLLRKAALDAVSQWIYQPPVLNGQKVEIVAPVQVIFRMSQ